MGCGGSKAAQVANPPRPRPPPRQHGDAGTDPASAIATPAQPAKAPYKPPMPLPPAEAAYQNTSITTSSNGSAASYVTGPVQGATYENISAGGSEELNMDDLARRESVILL